MKTTLSFGLLVAALVWAAGAPAADTAAADTASALAKLRSESIADRTAGAQRLMQDRKQTLRAIEQMAQEFIRNSARHGSAKTAITLLGDLRAAESVPFLVSNLTFEVFYKEFKRLQSVEDRFPCVESLIKLGSPCLEPLLARVQETDDAQVVLCAATVVHRILGNKPAAVFVEGRAAAQPDSQRRQRLLRLAERIAQTK